jgi:hypothetical protein
VVLCLSQDGACTDSFENFRENSLKGDLSNDITLNPSLFSLVNTFKLPATIAAASLAPVATSRPFAIAASADAPAVGRRQLTGQPQGR